MNVENIFTPQQIIIFATKYLLSEDNPEYYTVDLLIKSFDENEIEKTFIMHTKIVSDVLFDVIYEGSMFAENLVDTEYICNSVPVFSQTGEILYEMSIDAVLSNIFSGDDNF